MPPEISARPVGPGTPTSVASCPGITTRQTPMSAPWLGERAEQECLAGNRLQAEPTRRLDAMAELIDSPVRVEAAGQPPKTIEEFTGRASTGEERASVARMRSPAGWSEPGQRPEFDEYTVVLEGAVCVETDSGMLEVAAGRAVLVRTGEWVRYSTPEGAEYISVCLPAFSPDAVHRDA
jgi:mannose-6-phosphate isomerase-like protein (cupin superfamily)